VIAIACCRRNVGVRETLPLSTPHAYPFSAARIFSLRAGGADQKHLSTLAAAVRGVKIQGARSPV